MRNDLNNLGNESTQGAVRHKAHAQQRLNRVNFAPVRARLVKGFTSAEAAFCGEVQPWMTLLHGGQAFIIKPIMTPATHNPKSTKGTIITAQASTALPNDLIIENP